MVGAGANLVPFIARSYFCDPYDMALLKSFRRCAAWSGGLSIVAGVLFLFVAAGFYTKSQPEPARQAPQMPPGFGPRFNRLDPMGKPGEQKPAERNAVQQDLLMVAIGLSAVGLLTFISGVVACLKHRWALVLVILMSLLIPATSIVKGVFAPLVVYGPVLILSSLALKRSVELDRRGIPLSAKVTARPKSSMSSFARPKVRP